MPERAGPPVEELEVERTVLTPGSIELVLRNTGPDPVQIAQVIVNDTYVDFVGGDEPVGRMDSATVQLRYPWATGQPYVVGLLTSTGLVIEHESCWSSRSGVSRPACGRRPAPRSPA